MMIGGKDRELRYGLGAIRRLEKHFGEEEGKTRVPITEIFKRMQTGEVGLVVDLVWAGLVHEDPDLEIETVEKWLDETVDSQALIAEATKRIEQSFGKKKTKSKSKT